MMEQGIPLLGPAEKVISECTMREAYNVEVRIITVSGDDGRHICYPLLI
jgi:hypothetical protein